MCPLGLRSNSHSLLSWMLFFISSPNLPHNFHPAVLVAHTVPCSHLQLGHLKPREVRRSICTTVDSLLVVKPRLEPKSPLVYNVLPRIRPSLEWAAPAPRMISHSPDDSSLNLLPIVSHQWAEDHQLPWLGSMAPGLWSAMVKAKVKGSKLVSEVELLAPQSLSPVLLLFP